ncbi:MAG: DEAD/DEAH box helicase family protein [Deltaproteobacteria bacterium]|nr:DEAD/DEAH box helicase family protein [Deltaproteobacteria bacterium]
METATEALIRLDLTAVGDMSSAEAIVGLLETLSPTATPHQTSLIQEAHALFGNNHYISPGQELPSVARRRFSAVAPLAAMPIPVPLRDYQEAFVQRAMDRYGQGQDRGLLVLPTGAGKTMSSVALAVRLSQEWQEVATFRGFFEGPGHGFVSANWRRISSFLDSQMRPSGILYVTHRDFLLDQARDAFSGVFGSANVGLFQRDVRQTDRPILLASAQTLFQNLQALPTNRHGFLILDEAHHYVPENVWSDVLKYFGFMDANGGIHGVWPRLVIGMTATPDRLSGTPLVNVYGPEGLLLAVDAEDLWQRQDRVLLKPQAIQVELDQPVNTLSGRAIGDILGKLFYETLNWGNRFYHTLVYVNAVSQIEETVEALNKIEISAAGLSGETSPDKREEILDKFRKGEIRVLVNVGVAGEGFDVAGVELVVLGFESESRTRVVQDIGRAMRVDSAHPSKVAWVVDLGGNLARHRLNIHTQEAYEVEGATFVRKIKVKGDEEPKPRHPDAEGKVLDAGTVLFAGARPVTTQIRDAFTKLDVSAGEIQSAAYRLGISADVIFAYTNGLRVPSSLSEVLELAPQVGDQQGILHEAWAREKAAQMDLSDPLPANLTPVSTAFAQFLRFALWYKHEGVTTRIAGAEPATVRGWLEGRWENYAPHNELWEETFQRIFAGFEIPGNRKEFLGLLNDLLSSHNYPLFEDWMVSGTKEQILLFRLKALAKRLGRSPTIEEVNSEPGMASLGAYRRAFGNFNAALRAMGFEVNWEKYTREKLLADLQALDKKLGHSPTVKEVKSEPGMASRETYVRVFGSFNKALEAAGLSTRKQNKKL